ncbi:MAG: hypothetical protein ABEJ92_04160 [Halobacteriales archaeon]
MDRLGRHLLALLVVGGAAVAVAGPVAADNENLTITNVTIEPDPPAPGEPFTLRTTIANRPGGSQSVEITDVYLRDVSGDTEYERIENLGSVGEGQSMTVPMQLTLDRSRNLRVHVVGRAPDGQFVLLQYPVYVTVEPANDVQLSFAAPDATAGQETPVTVTVANGDTGPISNLRLTLGSPTASIANDRRVGATVPAGSERQFPFAVTFDEPGNRTLAASLAYTTQEGYRRTVRETTAVRVEPAVVDVTVDATVTNTNAVNPPVTVDVSNLGNVPVTDVVVRLADGDRTVARTLLGELPAQSSRTAAVNVSGLDDTTLSVTASYAFGDRTGTASTTVRYRSNPGRIELTGVDVEAADGHLQITGSASNVGLGAVNSVVLRVVETEGVEPVPPNREYFVGTVPASDFVSFDLTARVDSNVTAVPIEVTYLTDGYERTERVAVPVDVRPTPGRQPASPGRGLLVPVLVGAVVVLAVGGLMYLGWSNRGGG